MISQLKSNSVILINGKRTKVTQLDTKSCRCTAGTKPSRLPSLSGPSKTWTTWRWSW
jgi:hypothetical protein